MISTTKIEMDVSRNIGKFVPSIDVVQDDRYSRNIEITVLSNGTAVSLTGKKALIRYVKADGTGGNYDALPDGTPAFTISSNVLTVALAPQVCTFPGIVKMAVAIIDGETYLHTFPLDIKVHRNPGLQVHSENYLKIAGAVADSGWPANMYLGTDENGNVIAKESSFVKYVAQDLTPEQQAQARKNIDALKVPRVIARELFFFGEHDDFQTYGNQRIYKIAGQQVWMNSPADFDFRVLFNITRNIGQVEEYEFTKSDCTIIETVPGKKHWRFFANVSGSSSLVLTVANGIDPGSFESEPYCSFVYPSDLENYSVEFFKLSEAEQELNLVTSVNGIEADEYGNVQIDVGGGSGGGADGFSPIAKVTQTDTGAVISITDKKGTTTATVTNGKDGEKGDIGVSGVYVGSGEMPEGYNVQIDPSGEIDTLPTKLPNPHALKFTGAVQAEYDGSSPTTVNIPSGGSGGVSSWNDLTDKPFYTEMGNGVILPETAAIFVEDQGVFAIADPVALVIGEEYSVSWNGVPYSCVALPYEEEGVLMGAMLGNVGAMTGESITEEPFLVACVSPEMMEVTGSPVGIMIMPLDGSESVTLSISGLMEIVHPIDKKYLPKAAIPANGKVVFAKDDAGNYICNRTYEEIGMMFESGIFPWAQLNGVAYDGHPIFLKDFQVTHFGIQFSTTAYFQLANTGDNAVVGAFYVFVIVAESGEISCSVFRLDAKDVTP